MPVRMARLSSRLTALPTFFTTSASFLVGKTTSVPASTCGKYGKSTGLSVERVKALSMQLMITWSPSVATVMAASGRDLAMSLKSLPGMTVRPGSATSATTECLIEISRSVVWKVTELSSALTSMPLKMGSVERELMPLETIFNTSLSSLLAMLNLMSASPLSSGLPRPCYLLNIFIYTFSSSNKAGGNVDDPRCPCSAYLFASTRMLTTA